VLVFEEFVFVSSHRRTRLPLPGNCRKLTVCLVASSFLCKFFQGLFLPGAI
jgi:hypothetical protein